MKVSYDLCFPFQLPLCIRRRIERYISIPPNQQRLVYQGKQLTDEDELDELGLKDQIVHLGSLTLVSL